MESAEAKGGPRGILEARGEPCRDQWSQRGCRAAERGGDQKRRAERRLPRVDAERREKYVDGSAGRRERDQPVARRLRAAADEEDDDRREDRPGRKAHLGGRGEGQPDARRELAPAGGLEESEVEVL